MIFYTNWFIPARFGAFTYGPFIFIRPKYRDDVGLAEHEKTHVRQFFRNPLQPILYTGFKKYRLRYEAEAFAVQLKYNPEKLRYFAEMLSTRYGLGISVDDAIEAICG